jgi:hypothetical protein
MVPDAGPAMPRVREDSTLEHGAMQLCIAPLLRSLLKRVILWNNFRLGSFCAEVCWRGQFCRFRPLNTPCGWNHEIQSFVRLTNKELQSSDMCAMAVHTTEGDRYIMHVSLVFFFLKWDFWLWFGTPSYNCFRVSLVAVIMRFLTIIVGYISLLVYLAVE